MDISDWLLKSFKEKANTWNKKERKSVKEHEKLYQKMMSEVVCRH